MHSSLHQIVTCTQNKERSHEKTRTTNKIFKIKKEQETEKEYYILQQENVNPDKIEQVIPEINTPVKWVIIHPCWLQPSKLDDWLYTLLQCYKFLWPQNCGPIIDTLNIKKEIKKGKKKKKRRVFLSVVATSTKFATVLYLKAKSTPEWFSSSS